MGILLSIITVDYNGYTDTCDLIDSIPFNEQMEVIVVDNASQKDEATQITQRYPHIKAIRSKKNLGFSGGNNLGIQVARGKYLFFINNDTEFPLGEWKNIERLIHRMESNPKIGIICPKIRFAWDNHPIQFAGYTPLTKVTMRNHAIGFGEEDQGQYDTPHPTPYAHGAAMLVKREAIEKVGLMPENYFLYYEELDWSMMFTRAGYDIWYDPNCTIFHKESKSTGQASPLRTYYITRNRLLFARRNIQLPIRFLTYCYLMGIVGLRDIAIHTFKRRSDQRKASIHGICDFIKRRDGYKKMNNIFCSSE